MRADAIDQVLGLTFDLSRALREKMAHMRDKDCANVLQVFALRLIQEHPSITMKELADRLHITSPSATAFIDRLVDLRWVERRRDATNRKLVRLHLTQAGKAALRHAIAVQERILRPVLDAVSADDRNELIRILQTILRNVSSPSTLPNP